MIDVFFQSVTKAYSEKENPSFPDRTRTEDLPITSSDGLAMKTGVRKVQVQM